jgi:hypothetical protein
MALVSDCCGAYSEYADDIDLCPLCMEHCEFIDDEEEEDYYSGLLYGVDNNQ